MKTPTITPELLRRRRDFRCGRRVAVRVIRTDEERTIAKTVCRFLGLG
jgi:acetate kinase